MVRCSDNGVGHDGSNCDSTVMMMTMMITMMMVVMNRSPGDEL